MKHIATIEMIAQILKESKATPSEVRYIFKRVKEKGKYFVPKKPKTLPRYLTPAEIYYFLDVASQISPKHRLLVDFLIHTGLRINEARNVTIADFKENNQLLVRVAKFSKERYVPYSNSLLNKIKLYMSGREGYIWVNDREIQLSKRTLQNWIVKVAEKANMKDVHTHTMRHTFACLMLSKGLRIEALKTLMGHSSIKTTEIYARLELGAIKDKYLQLIGDS